MIDLLYSGEDIPYRFCQDAVFDLDRQGLWHWGLIISQNHPEYGLVHGGTPAKTANERRYKDLESSYAWGQILAHFQPRLDYRKDSKQLYIAD